jgi:hypothetical protein
MAEVSLLGGLVGCSINGIPRAQGITEVYTGSIFPVVVATAGGLCAWQSNLLSAAQGVTNVIPGVRQGVLAAMPGGLVEWTAWELKTRFLPWCSFDPPVVRCLTVNVTPYSNDPSGREITLSIDWGDGLTTPVCPEGQPSSHNYTASRRYTITVRATNTLGDSAGLSRDVVVVAYPERVNGWRPGQSPGTLSTETEPGV